MFSALLLLAAVLHAITRSEGMAAGVEAAKTQIRVCFPGEWGNAPNAEWPRPDDLKREEGEPITFFR